MPFPNDNYVPKRRNFLELMNIPDFRVSDNAFSPFHNNVINNKGSRYVPFESQISGVGTNRSSKCATAYDKIFLKSAIPGLFVFIFVFFKTVEISIGILKFLMVGFEPWTSGVGSNHSTN